MNAREQILQRIGTALGRAETGATQTVADQPAAVTERLQGARRSTLPKVGDDLVETAIANMESVLMSVVRLQTLDNCVDAVQDYLASHGVDGAVSGAVTVAPALSSIAWPSSYRCGPATGEEQVSITPCLAAVAETGSVVTASGAQTPAGLNFLPETHITVLYESQIVQYVDDVFSFIREFDALPRAINLVTGPSRTADIEQTLEIGAHGPRRMHVLLIAGEPA